MYELVGIELNITAGNQTEINTKYELVKKYEQVGIGMNITAGNQKQITIKYILVKRYELVGIGMSEHYCWELNRDINKVLMN